MRPLIRGKIIITRYFPVRGRGRALTAAHLLLLRLTEDWRLGLKAGWRGGYLSTVDWDTTAVA